MRLGRRRPRRLRPRGRPPFSGLSRGTLPTAAAPRCRSSRSTRTSRGRAAARWVYTKVVPAPGLRGETRGPEVAISGPLDTLNTLLLDDYDAKEAMSSNLADEEGGETGKTVRAATMRPPSQVDLADAAARVRPTSERSAWKESLQISLGLCMLKPGSVKSGGMWQLEQCPLPSKIAFPRAAAAAARHGRSGSFGP